MLGKQYWEWHDWGYLTDGMGKWAQRYLWGKCNEGKAEIMWNNEGVLGKLKLHYAET